MHIAQRGNRLLNMQKVTELFTQVKLHLTGQRKKADVQSFQRSWLAVVKHCPMERRWEEQLTRMTGLTTTELKKKLRKAIRDYCSKQNSKTFSNNAAERTKLIVHLNDALRKQNVSYITIEDMLTRFMEGDTYRNVVVCNKYASVFHIVCQQSCSLHKQDQVDMQQFQNVSLYIFDNIPDLKDDVRETIRTFIEPFFNKYFNKYKKKYDDCLKMKTRLLNIFCYEFVEEVQIESTELESWIESFKKENLGWFPTKQQQLYIKNGPSIIPTDASSTSCSQSGELEKLRQTNAKLQDENQLLKNQMNVIDKKRKCDGKWIEELGQMCKKHRKALVSEQTVQEIVGQVMKHVNEQVNNVTRTVLKREADGMRNDHHELCVRMMD